MTDREKVIESLKHCVVTGDFCGECPYDGMESCIEKLHDDALSMLKEQEAKKPVEYEHNSYWYYICPTCENHDEELFREWNYCPFCGQELEWR